MDWAFWAIVSSWALVVASVVDWAKAAADWAIAASFWATPLRELAAELTPLKALDAVFNWFASVLTAERALWAWVKPDWRLARLLFIWLAWFMADMIPVKSRLPSELLTVAFNWLAPLLN